MPLTRRPQRAQRVRPEDRIKVGDLITRMTVGVVDFGVRVKWDRLEPGQAADLVALVQTAKTDGDGLNLEKLSKKERGKLEHLIEVGGDCPGLFESAREQAQFEAEVRALAQRAQRPERRPRYEEEGSVVIPKAAFDQLAKTPPHLLLADVGLYVFVLLQMENGAALCPGASIEGDRLVINDRLGLGARYDPEGRQTDWRDRLQHLARNHWLAVERRGPEWLIGRGRTTVRVQKGRRT